MNVTDYIPIPDLDRCSSLLCIQPHPDDNEVGAGATIAKLAAAGCHVTYLTVTDGSKGSSDPDMKPEAMAALRKKEAETSAGILGVTDLRFLGIPDGECPAGDSLRSRIVAVIREVKPEIVMTADPFLPYECHPDHRATGMAAAEACLFSSNVHYDNDGIHTPWSVAGIAFYGTAWPNAFINVDATWDAKMAALAAHKSQFDPQYLGLLAMYFDSKAREYALDKGFERAEAFKVLAPTYMHMSVDSIHL